MSKGYVVSRAADVQVVVFKFVLAAHDLFSLFYIFSTLIGKEEPKEAALFGNEGGLYVSHLSYGWLICCVIAAVYWTMFLSCTGVVMILHRCFVRARGFRAKDLGFTLLIIGAYFVLCIPVVIAAVGTQLLWLVGYIASQEPRTEYHPTMATMFRFVSRGNWDQRSLYLLEKFIEREDMEHVVGEGSKKTKIRGDLELVVQEKPFRARRLITKHYRENFCRCNMSAKKGEQIGQVFLGVGITLYVGVQIYTLLFPFVSYGLRFQTQNLLQHFCFISMIVPTVIALFLAPRASSYLYFSLQFRYHSCGGRGSSGTACLPGSPRTTFRPTRSWSGGRCLSTWSPWTL